MFEKSQFYINILKNFESFYNFAVILILVKIFEDFNCKLSQKLDFIDNWRKIPILSQNFRKLRLQS